MLVYETIEDSQYHEEVVEKLSGISLVRIPSNVMVEFVLVLGKLGLSANFISRKVSDVLSEPGVKLEPLTPRDFSFAMNVLAGEKAGVARLNDKLLLAVAKRTGSPIYTYDRRLANQARRYGVKTL